MWKSKEEVERAINALTPIQTAYFNKVVKVNLPEITDGQSILDVLQNGKKHSFLMNTYYHECMFLFCLAYGNISVWMDDCRYMQLYNAMETENQALRSLIHG